MSSNKKAREELIALYGPECFIEKLHLRQDTTPRHYTSKGQMQKMKALTYHHIKEKHKGGKATVENGALLSLENHQWFNKQSAEKQAEMNEKFQKYKKCKVVFTNENQPTFSITPAKMTPIDTTIKIEPLDVYKDMTKEEIEIYKKHKQKRNERIFKKFER